MKLKIPQIEITLKYKGNVKTEDLFTITKSSDVHDAARAAFNADKILWQEQFMVLLLNQANKVVGYHCISSGGITGTIADPRLIIGLALKANAVSIILAHNHPSGNTKPSAADLSMTQKVKKAVEMFDMKILDHVIVTDCGYYSFADNGDL